MKGHAIFLADVLKMFPQFRKNGLTKYRFAEGKNQKFLVLVGDIAEMITNKNRAIMLATYVTYFDTELVPVVVGSNKIK